MIDDGDMGDDWERSFYEKCDQAKREHDRDSGVHEAEIERLALLSELNYAVERRPAARQLDIPVSLLDKLVRAERSKKRKKAATVPNSDLHALKHSANRIIDHPNILDLFVDEFGKAIAGEEVNGKLLYLVATSRLFDKPMNAAIKGTSAGGKSEIRKRVLEFFPPEDVIAFTSLSEKALIYHDGDFAHKILSMGEATATEEQQFQDYLLRELMSEGRIRHSAPQKVGNEIQTVTIEKQGPVAFLVTTTKHAMHPENETRMLSIEIDDSADQTRKVLDKVASVDGLHDAAPLDYGPWQDFQRWVGLGECRVVVPFAKVMASLMPAAAVRLRRDIGQVICAIKAHALLHRDQRILDDAGRIVADIENDYAVIRGLMNSALAESAGVAINPAITETIDAVAKATIGMMEPEGANSKAIAKLLKLDKSAARRRLLAACDDGYVVNLEQRRNMPGKYRLTGQKPEGADILPTTAELTQRLTTPLSDEEPVPPCHRDEIAQTSQADNGGKYNDKSDQFADSLPPDNPPDGNGKSLPVARWHDFSGEDGDDDSIPAFLRRCEQCGEPSSTIKGTVLHRQLGDVSHWLHEQCDFGF